jgi:hypothetical protein
MKFLSLVFTVLILAVPVAFAQDKAPVLQGFGSPTPEDRGGTRVLYWHSEKNVPLGQLAINYGRPAWKKEYENQAMFDTFTKGKVWRFGKDFWTTLDTALPLKIAGKDVAPGLYYLGLQRSADGATWSLAFIDPAKARKGGMDAFAIDKAPVDFQIPIKFEKIAEANDKLAVVLIPGKDNPKEVMLKINWGPLQLTAPIQVTVQM